MIVKHVMKDVSAFQCFPILNVQPKCSLRTGSCENRSHLYGVVWLLCGEGQLQGI